MKLLDILTFKNFRQDRKYLKRLRASNARDLADMESFRKFWSSEYQTPNK